jgi:hypothetical protein
MPPKPSRQLLRCGAAALHCDARPRRALLPQPLLRHVCSASGSAGGLGGCADGRRAHAPRQSHHQSVQPHRRPRALRDYAPAAWAARRAQQAAPRGGQSRRSPGNIGCSSRAPRRRLRALRRPAAAAWAPALSAPARAVWRASPACVCRRRSCGARRQSPRRSTRLSARVCALRHAQQARTPGWT